MTDTPEATDLDPADIGAALLEELRSLRATVEKGIDSANAATANVVRVEAKSDRRARRYLRFSIVMVAAFVLFIGISTAGYLVNEAHRADDDAQRRCFQNWANRTAARTLTITQANSDRVDTLNDVLAIRARTDHGPQLQAALEAASTAGERYEQIARDNPPVPPSTLSCAS